VALQISGLTSSGLDTASIVSQLMQVESNPQTLLKNQLISVKADAAAYRALNTRFDALRTAAAALTGTTITTARTATVTGSGIATASASTSAVTGSSITFSVTSLSSTQSLISATTWGSATDLVTSQAEPAWPIEIRDSTGTTTLATVNVDADDTLLDAAQKINDANAGVVASVIKTADTNGYRLQITNKTPGAAGAVMVVSATDTPATLGSHFVETSPGRDATLDLGGGVTATSSTNAFADLLAGVSVTVSKADPATPVTVAVAQDSAGIASKMQNVVDQANDLLSSIASYTDTKSDSAILKGDVTVRGLAGQILDVVSSAVGTHSATEVGLQVTKDGKLTFDKAKFTTALTNNPSLVNDIVASALTSTGIDGVAGTADDVTTPVGVAAQLEALAKRASDATTGTLITLANGEDARAKDMQDRIDNWDIRLAMRKQTLTAQFTAMETALSSLDSQSSWLKQQLNSLPSWSSSKS
jgi:flagellar hook-associated protein 2